ncbi:MAG TPA: bifunctional folylpolyglutamate synthase/dihydrofolate synthase [Clostridia bacterium]|jgi:dihydrofolate synthase/folylpolyglutamate synthase|nr:bifunctional folylpolyglutamate synthase/dihydrofolate synthase [Clostridia bacterium]
METALAKLEKIASPGSVLGLQRMEVLLNILNNPQDGLKVIHVAGTNGKGSTCATISSILHCAGYNVGMYTSPHLIEFNERIKINNQNISDGELEHFSQQLLEKLKDWSKYSKEEFPTQFELYTALALNYFASRNLDFVVLEVGLGGRLDATNLVNSLISVITPVSYDHQDRLGKSLAEIAREKAGIIKNKGTVVVAPQEREAEEVIAAVAADLGARVYWVGKDTNYRAVRISSQENVFNYSGLRFELTDLVFNLKGKHQLVNAAVALTVVEVLNCLGYNFTEEAVRKGLEETEWPGRLEVVKDKPLLIIDGAHNPHAARVLAEELANNFSYRYLILIIGILEDKDMEGILEQLVPIADLIIITKPESERAASPQAVYDLALNLAKGELIIKDDIQEAVDFALSRADKDDLICVAGSLYLIGKVKKLLTR